MTQYPLYKSGGSYFIDFPPLPGEEVSCNHVEIYAYNHCEWCWLNEEEQSGPWGSLKEAEGSAREIYASKCLEGVRNDLKDAFEPFNGKCLDASNVETLKDSLRDVIVKYIPPPSVPVLNWKVFCDDSNNSPQDIGNGVINVTIICSTSRTSKHETPNDQ
jgi:hypothetical protein